MICICLSVEITKKKNLIDKCKNKSSVFLKKSTRVVPCLFLFFSGGRVNQLKSTHLRCHISTSSSSAMPTWQQQLIFHKSIMCPLGSTKSLHQTDGTYFSLLRFHKYTLCHSQGSKYAVPHMPKWGLPQSVNTCPSVERLLRCVVILQSAANEASCLF